MFTGLIEEQGTVVALDQQGSNLDITIQASLVIEDLAIGDSIAIDGVCQTVTSIEANQFRVTAIEETLKLTNFISYKEGSRVNLERCLKASDRLGGHIVQGHVDGLGTLESIEDRDGSYEVTIEISDELAKYVIHKGSIAINGISLTIAGLDANRVMVCIIPKTWEMTNLASLQAGEQVNIEVDQAAKYIEKFVVKS